MRWEFIGIRGAIEGVGTGVADKQLNDKITAKEGGSTTIFNIGIVV